VSVEVMSAKPSTSPAKGRHGTRSQPFSGMRANQRTGSVDGWPEAGTKKAGRQQLGNQHRDLSVTIAQVNPCRSFGIAHSSPEEQGSLAAALCFSRNIFLTHVRPARASVSGTRIAKKTSVSIALHGRIRASLRRASEIFQLIRKRDRAAYSGAVPTSGPYGNARTAYVRWRTHAERDL
jgi:hypothetical protein